MIKTHQESMTDFDDERKPLVEALLKAILEACPTLTETIKWNAPSFCFNGKDRLTIMLHKKDRVGLILHTGAKPKEDKNAPHLYTDETEYAEIPAVRWDHIGGVQIAANVAKHFVNSSINHC